jgi:hypothetical protein
VSRLEQILEASIDQEGPEKDLTMSFQMEYNTPDRSIIRARMVTDRSIMVTIGLRSAILEPFERFHISSDGEFLACDIPGLIPAVAVILRSQSRGVAAGAIERDSTTRIILAFESDRSVKDNGLRNLASTITCTMRQWGEWTGVLLGTLDRDPIVGDWEIDWREFLAGEAGFVTMPWFRSLGFQDRKIALSRTILAAEALLISVLNRKQLTDPITMQVRDWMKSLSPQPHVAGSHYITVEKEIF